MHYTLVRLPLFLENYYGFITAVKEAGVVRCCIDPECKYTPIAVTDIGEALANIAADEEGLYLDETLSLAGEAHTVSQFVQWLSEALGMPVGYEREQRSVTRETLLGFGFLPWQVPPWPPLPPHCRHRRHRADDADDASAPLQSSSSSSRTHPPPIYGRRTASSSSTTSSLASCR